jgi:uncharacterized membrane protein YfcA
VLNPLNLALLLVAGGIAGFLSALFEVGGGIILVPALLAILTSDGVSSLVATHITFGTCLLSLVCVSVYSTWRYSHDQHVLWKAAAVMGIAGALSAWGGALLAESLQGGTLRTVFGVVTGLVGLRLLGERRRSREVSGSKAELPRLVLIGLGAGLVSSLSGAGSSILSAPGLYSFLRFPLMKSRGTSDASMVIITLVGAVGYAWYGRGNPSLPAVTLGYVDAVAAVPLALGTVAGMRLGASAAGKMQTPLARKILALLLLILAIRMLVL